MQKAVLMVESLVLAVLLGLLLWTQVTLRWQAGRIHNLGEEGKQVSKRPLTQANRMSNKWVKVSSPQRIPTPLNRCWMSPYSQKTSWTCGFPPTQHRGSSREGYLPIRPGDAPVHRLGR
jgi:hypothetical protein